MKEAGILMPVSALPSRTGVGELGAAAYQWIDLMHEAGITIWQILPLNPLDYGNSPYQPSLPMRETSFISAWSFWRKLGF